MLLNWSNLLGNRRHKRKPQRRARTALRLEQLEQRCCPSTFVVQIPESFPPAGAPSLIKGEHIHLDIAVASDDPNDPTEGEREAVFITSSAGFHTSVNIYTTKSLNYRVKQNGETFSVSDTDGDETGTITVAVDAPHLVFSRQPVSTIAKKPMHSITVEVVDDSGNRLKSFNGDVTLSVEDNPGNAIFSGLGTVQARGGFATFRGVSADTPGEQYSLAATLDDGTLVQSDFFNIGEKLVFVKQPKNSLPNEPVTPTVAVKVENFDGTPANYSGDVTLTVLEDGGFYENPSGGVATVGAGGIATFPGLSIDAGTNLALQATTSDGSFVFSRNFNVQHTLRITHQPTTTGVNQPMNSPVVVKVFGPNGKTLDKNFNGTVSLFLGSDPSHGVAQLSNSSVTAQNGVATFSNLTINTAGGGYTVIASLSGFSDFAESAPSKPFNVGLALSFTGPIADGVPGGILKGPSVLVKGHSHPGPVTVEVDEVDGSPDTAYKGDVTLSFASGFGTLSGNVAAVHGGRAVFPNLSISASGSFFQLTASATGAADGISNTFTVEHMLAFTAQPTASSANVVGQVIKPPFKVTVYGPDGKTIDTHYSGTVTLGLETDASVSFDAHLGGILTVHARKGVAVFNDVILDQPSAKGEQYELYAFSSDDAFAVSKGFTIKSSRATKPVVVTNPVNQEACVDETVTFTAAASGVPVPSVQWQFAPKGSTAFTNIPFATSDSLTVTAVVTTSGQNGENGDHYRAVFTSGSNKVTSKTATLVVDKVPSVTKSPADQSVPVGNQATFTAAATNSKHVQWQFSADGGSTFADIPGATQTKLVVTAIPGATGLNGQDGDEYRAVFFSDKDFPADSDCSAFTSAATLTVTGTAAPVVSGQPLSHAVSPGSTVIFTAQADGNPAPTVQWESSTDHFKTFAVVSTGVNTTTTGNTASTTLTLTGVTTAMSGTQYRVVFSNSLGTLASSIATLTVATPTPAQVTSNGNPADQTVKVGQSATFTAAATGFPTPTVQWQVSTDGGETFQNLTGGKVTNTFKGGVETSTLVLTHITAAQDGAEYLAVFTNATGDDNTQPAVLTVRFGPTITLQPVSQGSPVGNQVTFTADANGEPAPAVQWELSTDGGHTFTNINSATSNALTVTTVTGHGTATGQDGDLYRAVFTSGSVTATTAAAKLSVGPLPVITEDTTPSNQTVSVGQNVTFTAKATGSTSVQWQVSSDGGATFTPFTAGHIVTSLNSGVTTTTLSFAAAASQDGDLFQAVFSDGIGPIATTPASMDLTSPPVVIDQPGDTTVTNGSTATFTLLPGGDPNPTIQWQISTDGGKTFMNLTAGTSPNGDAFAGATADMLTITTSSGDAGKTYQLRAVLSNTIGTKTNTVFSNVVKLTVN